ncbi:hypothetical protein GA0115259_103611 [Streptomyces sp. MnatMP-M17]|nr:hypothetical protein GA0115259_103611 [Streptomyces sp. MnatMP-M17]
MRALDVAQWHEALKALAGSDVNDAEMAREAVRRSRVGSHPGAFCTGGDGEVDDGAVSASSEEKAPPTKPDGRCPRGQTTNPKRIGTAIAIGAPPYDAAPGPRRK